MTRRPLVSNDFVSSAMIAHEMTGLIAEKEE